MATASGVSVLLVMFIGATLGGCVGGGSSIPIWRSAPPSTSVSANAAGSHVPTSTVAGWPVALPASDDDAIFAFSADGGLFAAADAEITAYDPRGHVRPGWPVRSPVDAPVRAIAVALDGSLLVAGDHQVSDVNLAGTVTAGWPITLAGRFGWLSVSPESIVVADQPAGNAQGLLRGLSLAGPEHVAWTTPIAGRPAEAPAVGSDGTVYLPVSQGDPATAAIIAVSARGTIRPGYPVPWRTGGLAVAPDGAPVVWSYDTTGSGAIVAVQRLHLARLDATGQVAPGWPQVIDGPVSAPTIAADGTMYLVAGDPYGSGTGSVIALDPTGHPRSGWPARLPTECQGAGQDGAATDLPITQSPVIGRGGLVYVEATCGARTMVVTYDGSGKPIVNGGYELPDGAMIGGLGGGVPGGPRHDLIVGATGLIFFFVQESPQQSALIALDGGRVAAGWPLTTVAAGSPRELHPTEDGGLVVVYLDSGTNHLAATRFLATGTTPTSP